MRDYLIRAALTDYLERENTPADEVERFEFFARRRGEVGAYPCPACFVLGEEQALILRLAGDWVDQAFCPECKRHYKVPVSRE